MNSMTTEAGISVADQLYADLETKVRALRPTDDVSALRAAYEFAAHRHARQMRSSGEP